MMPAVNLAVLTVVMALTTYLVRMIPFVLFRKQIKSVFLRSLIYYMPYAILSAMTIPGIFYATGDIRSAVAGFVVAVILALRERSLLVISLSASGAALAVWLLTTFIL